MGNRAKLGLVDNLAGELGRDNRAGEVCRAKQAGDSRPRGQVKWAGQSRQIKWDGLSEQVKQARLVGVDELGCGNWAGEMGRSLLGNQW